MTRRKSSWPWIPTSAEWSCATTGAPPGHGPLQGGGLGEGCKDANEYLLKYDLPRLRQQVEQAAEIPLEGVFCPMDEWDTLMDIYYNGMPEGADTGLENLDRLIKFERGFVLTVTGVPGSGKSEFVDEIAMRLLLRHDWKVGYFSPENTPLAYHYRKLIRRVVGKRFEHKGMPLPEAGQAIRYLAQSVFSIMPKEDFSVESVLRIAAQLVSRKGVKVLVVDPFNRFEHQIPDWETETQYISRIFDEFSNFAVKHKVLLILVAHPTKLRREPGSKRWPVPTLYDINGSAAFFNKTDYGMVIDRNDELGQVLVRVAKVRFDHLADREMLFSPSALTTDATLLPRRGPWIIIRLNRSGSIPIS